MEDKDGTFLVVDLETSTGVGVVIVPDFWFSSNSCRYPPLSRKGTRAITSREKPGDDWLNYPAVCRGAFGSYQEARRKLTVAEVVSDINIPSDAEGVNLGRGKRNKRPRVTYSPGNSSGDEEETTLSSAPPVPPNLLVRHSPSFSSQNIPLNGSCVPNNNNANNSASECRPTVAYGHTTGSLTSHGHIGSSVNTLDEFGPSAQYAHPGSSASYRHFVESRNLSTENSPSPRHCYTVSSESYGYLRPSMNSPTDHVMSVGHEMQYVNLGSSTSFAHHGLSPSIARPQSSASVDRSRSSFVMDRPGSSTSVARPGSSASVALPGSSDSIVQPGSSVSVGTPESFGSIDRPGSSGSIARPGSSISETDSGFSGEHLPSFATNGSYGHHSQPESFHHLPQFSNHVMASPSNVHGHPLESISSLSQRSDTSEICRSVVPTANALPVHAQSSNQVITGNGVFVGLSTRPNIKSPPAEIMVRIVQSLERIAEQQRVQDARLIALDRRFDNLQQFQQQSSNIDQITDISGLPVKNLEELLEFEEKIKTSEHFFELVRFIRTIGGTSTANVVIRSWDKVLSLEAKASCNWLGQQRKGNKKHALKDSRVTKAIFRGIRATPQFRSVQESELIVETKKALKHAPEKARHVAAAAAAAAADAEDDDGDDGDDGDGNDGVATGSAYN